MQSRTPAKAICRTLRMHEPPSAAQGSTRRPDKREKLERSGELCVERDFGIQNFRDRTVLLRLARHLLEALFTDARNFGAQGKRGAADAEGGAFLVDGHGGFGVEFLRRDAGALQ